MKNWIANNKKTVAAAIAFVAGGLAAIGYGIPEPFITVIYATLGLN